MRLFNVHVHCLPLPLISLSAHLFELKTGSFLPKKNWIAVNGSFFRQNETKSLRLRVLLCVCWKLSVNAKSIQNGAHRHKTYIHAIDVMMIINGLYQHTHKCHSN